MFDQQKLGIIGTGKIGKILTKGFLESHLFRPDQIIVHDAHQETGQALVKELGVQWADSNGELAQQADLLLLCVKPFQMEAVCKELAPFIRNDHIVFSIAAGITTPQISGWLGTTTPILRGMPNTPALLGVGVTGLCRGTHATEQHFLMAYQMFSAVGLVVPVEEKLMDAVTGLSASGPAYIYLIIEALADGGVAAGLPRDTAIKLAAQTTLGAAKMVLETKEHPAKLKDEVTTPAGTTIAGLRVLEEGVVRTSLIKAVLAATERARELSK